jgi:hypothetical protein
VATQKEPALVLPGYGIIYSPLGTLFLLGIAKKARSYHFVIYRRLWVSGLL